MRLAALLFCVAALASGAEIERSSVIQRSFTLSGAAPGSLKVENIWGFIHVSGTTGSAIELVAHKTIHADTAAEADQAEREVKLDISQNGNAVRLYVDGPWRDHCHCWEQRDYRVSFNFDLKVPPGTRLDLSTVNDGNIEARNTSGDFDLKNVNGEIVLADVGGSGKVSTVNGPIRASFTRNPAGDCSFKTINGPIEIEVQPDLSADLRFKTFNGGVYTDFPVTALPRMKAVSERRDGKFIYRSGDFQGARIGAGGPELKFETLNGDVRILKRGKS